MNNTYSDQQLLKTFENEATFGFNQCSEAINKHFKDAQHLDCLEVGSGPGLLLKKLKEHYSNFSFEGIEPAGKGFSKTDEVLTRVLASSDITVHRCMYENFNTEKKYDLIFSVNVIEHVDSWADYLNFTLSKLKPGGVCLSLCPNYSFPYESHFILPIIINKNITQKIFKNKIKRFEDETNSHQLWDSLNFIKRRKVKKYLKQNNIKYEFDNKIISSMFNRILTDEQFIKRQGLVGKTAQIIHKLKLSKIFDIYPFTEIQPYMKFIVIKQGC